jgi:hypothetical protein
MNSDSKRYFIFKNTVEEVDKKTYDQHREKEKLKKL